MAVVDLTLRLSEQQYQDFLVNGKLNLEKPKRTNSAKLSAFSKDENPKKKKSPVTLSIESIKNAEIVKEGDWVFAKGVRFLNTNQTLRIDHRSMYGYIKACHKLAGHMSYLMPKGAIEVDMVVHRTGKRLIDNDAVVSGFKFLIDGLRKCGVFPDDSPRFVRKIEYEQTQGEYQIGIKVTKNK